MNKPAQRLVKLWLIAATALLVLLVLAVTTYAWFTSNKFVASDSVQVHSGSQSLRLEIAPAAGGPFAQETGITKLSTGDVLDPVSTADLKSFFKSTLMTDNQAGNFVLTDKGYYHGQVFLQAFAEGQPDNARVDLYFDTDGIVVREGETPGQMLNAARVGLVFGGAQGDNSGNPLIFSLSQAHNPGNDSYTNTALPGAAGDFVLSGSAGAVSAVPDPALDPLLFTLQEGGGGLSLPNAPLVTLPLNQVIAVDVYFYLEGCDADCTNAIRTTEMSIQLPFYGVLTTGGAA